MPILGYGYLGVDLFFILSGYVIWHVHGAEFARANGVSRPRLFTRFMALRAARLYPVHLLTLGLVALLVWLAPQIGDPPLNPANYTLRELMQQLVLVQSWGFSGHLSWNYPAWSVSAEWFCYLLFPAIAFFAARSGRRGTIIAIGILLVGVTTTYWTAFGESLNQAVGALTLLRAAPEFLLGCLLCRLSGQVRMEDWPWGLILGVVFALWVASFFTFLPVALLALPLFAVLILAAASPRHWIARVASLRPLVAVGAASYSLYLMQAPVQKGARVLRHWVSPHHPLQSTFVFAVFFTLLAAGTYLVHRFAETPSRRLLRRRLDLWVPARPQAKGGGGAAGRGTARRLGRYALTGAEAPRGSPDARPGSWPRRS